MLNITDALSRFIQAQPEQSLAKRLAAVFAPRVLLTTAVTATYLGMASRDSLPAPALLLEVVRQAQAFATISPPDIAQPAILLYGGITLAMTILERLMQPLITASERRGRQQGRQEGHEEAAKLFQQWKAQQLAHGVTFVEPDKPEEPTDTTDEPHRAG